MAGHRDATKVETQIDRPNFVKIAEAVRQAKTKTQEAVEGGRYTELHDLAVKDHTRKSCCMFMLHVHVACRKQGKLPCSSIGSSCRRRSSKAARASATAICRGR